MSPVQHGRSSPLCASTPMPKPERRVNGHDDTDGGDTADVVNGNLHVNAVTEAAHSLEVLSGGESEAGDTLNRRNNNNISATLSSNKDASLRKRSPDVTYFIAKELLMTERTYKRDLELITVTWSSVVSALSRGEGGAIAADGASGASGTSGTSGVDVVLARACLAVGEAALAAGAALAPLDELLSADGGDPGYKKVGKFLYDHLTKYHDMFQSYTHRAGALVASLESARRGAAVAAREAAAFDRAAPLPLPALLLRPLHRLLHYELLAKELMAAEPGSLAGRLARRAAALAAAARGQLRHVQHHAAMCQLAPLLADYDKILVAGREFIRLGCVYKHSSMGIQQRMLFLFSDILVIASKWGSHDYKTHKVIALHAITFKHADLPHSFQLIGEDTNILISTSNDHEYTCWQHSFEEALEAARANPAPVDTELTGNSDEPEELTGPTLTATVGGLTGSLADSVTQVCWHRVTSLSEQDLYNAMATMLSGYLLRKFKKSAGWQKLWVVFAGWRLFFYKTWQEPEPLAALPLHGYSISKPMESDKIDKEFVFKLEYKSHVYFFRADSQYTYRRWTETLQIAMVQPNHKQS